MKNPLANHSIGVKLAWGFGFVLLLTLIVASAGFYGVNTLLERANKVHISKELNSTVIALREQRQLYLNDGVQTAYQNVLKLEDELTRTIQESAKTYTVPSDLKLVNEASASLEQYKSTFANLYSVREQWADTGKQAAAVRQQIYDEIDVLLQHLRSADNKAAEITTLFAANDLYQSTLIITEYVRQGEVVPEEIIRQHIPNITSDLRQLSLSGAARVSQQKVLNLFKEYSDLLALNPPLTRQLEEGGKKLLALSKVMSSNLSALGESQQTKSREDGSNVRISLIVITLLAIVMGIFFALFIRHMIVTPMRDLAKAVETIANGDLSQTYSTDRRDELGKLYNDMGKMSITLNNLIAQVVHSVLNLSATSEQLETISKNSQSMMQSQKDETDQVATAINEMSATVAEVARNAETAAMATNKTDEMVSQGNMMVNAAVEQITGLAAELNTTSEAMETLKLRSDNVGNVLEVIKAVAEQTNLLALNAAIEAARAGEAGRGFAVVADEVRGLASRTQDSTKEIESLINELQNGAQASLEQIQSSRDKSVDNAEKAKSVLALFENIGEQMGHVQDMTQQIATAAEQQSQVADDINHSVENVRQLADQTTDGTQESVQAVSTLKSMSLELKTLTERFKTKRNA